ncbi:MAG TPA: aspartyl protease family protein [Puia sp.]|nr:aspartyl protease family protein [Puia sp.]
MTCWKNITPNLNRIFLSPLLIACLLQSLPSAAQEEFIPPPSRLLTRIPFQLLTGGIIVVRARVNNFPDTLTFIFDTGSGGISLDSTTAQEMKLQTFLTDRTIRGIAGIRKVSFAYNLTLRLPNLEVDSLNFHISDYDILTSVYGLKIDGIIGYSFLSRYIVKVNYDSNIIDVYTNGTTKYPKGGFLLRPIFAGLPVQGARVRDGADVFARFYFDTGAGLCLLLSSDFVQDSSLFAVKKKRPVITEAEGLGGKTAMELSTVKDFRLGPYHFRNVPTYVFDDIYNVTSYPSLGGLIGNDLLRRFNCILNYERREIYLIPNSHFTDPFDYSYTGLGIYWIDGAVRVADVMKDSPAEKGGFKEGDIIIAVGNNVSNNIQTYKNLLQNIGEKVTIIVRRPTGLQELSIRVRSIF